MSRLLTTPNELLDEIVSYLEPVATFYLLLTCRSLRSRVGPAMLRHAVAPKRGMLALHWAARKGHLPLVQYLLTVMPIDLRGPGGNTALHEAAWAYNFPVVEQLLLNGANVNILNTSGWAVILGVCYKAVGNHEVVEAIVRILLAYGADVRSAWVCPTLSAAIGRGLVVVTQLLLAAGTSPDPVDHIPPIVYAARFADAAVFVEMLLNYGADVNATDNRNNTSIMIAAKYGRLAAVKSLVDRGANLNSVDYEGGTALASACRHRHRDVVEYLVGCEGLDIAVTIRGPVYQTVFHGYDIALRILLQRGAAIHYEDYLGQSLMHVAVSRGRETVVRTLLENGANIEMEVNDGLKLLKMAMDLRSISIVTLLVDYGMDRIWGSEVTLAAQRRMGTWSKVASGAAAEEGH